MIISSCPVRLSFGSADLEPYSSKFGGVALNFSINKRIYVILRRLSDFELINYRVSYSKTENCQSIDEIQLPPVREALKFMGIKDRLDIIYTADVPARMGLATSTAFILALLHALYRYKDQRVSPEFLAQQSYVLEREVMNETGGFQDHYCGFGGVNLLEGFGKNVRREPIFITPDNAERLESHMLMVYTNKQEHSVDVLQEQVKNLETNYDVILNTNRIKSLVYEMYAHLSQAGPLDIQSLIDTMNEQWALKKTLSSRITSQSIAEIENRILNAAPPEETGLRLVGSGGHGCILVLSKHSHAIYRALEGKNTVARFKIEWVPCRIHE